MGEQNVRAAENEATMREFTRMMLRDLRALEMMLDRGMFETGVRRAGVEQEMFLVTGDYRQAPVAPEVLARIDDPRFTTELARFNLEANLDPQPFGGPFLRNMEQQLNAVVETVQEAAKASGAKPLLTGILPTLRRSDLSAEYMSPQPRYRWLSEALLRMRGGAFRISIDGVDDLDLQQENVMLESANTSFQLHLQVSPEDLVWYYNVSQLLSAPLLAAAVNSPTLLGKHLWQETRVALFERAVDARTTAELSRGQQTRVSFGRDWLRGSVLEIFREDAANFRPLLSCEPGPDPVEAVERGEAPRLAALQLHNGTVWRWNRPCYGVADGVARLRIENRVLPSGPSVIDEVANAALFYGMMAALPEVYGDPAGIMPFENAKANFVAAARNGLDAELIWLDGEAVPVRDLLLQELIPAAREGLRDANVPDADVERYLGTLEARVESGRTGARWMVEATRAVNETDVYTRVLVMTSSMSAYQEQGLPVHEWGTVAGHTGHTPDDAGGERRVSDFMTEDLFTVRPQDVVDLATSVMDWRHIRHVPVESDAGDLVGLISHRSLLSALEHMTEQGTPEAVAIATIMDTSPATIRAEATLREAIRALLESGGTCLLVMSDGRLAGLVTERDLLREAGELLEQVLSERRGG